MHNRVSHKRLFILLALQIGVLLLLIFALAPRLGSTSKVVTSVADASWPFILLSVVFYVSMYGFSAVAHGILLPGKQRFQGLLAAQFAGGFASRILPNGFGGSGFLVWHYHKKRTTWGRAVAIILINNGLGWLANTLFLILFLPAIASEHIDFKLPSNLGAATGIVAIVGLAIATFATVLVLGGYTKRAHHVWRQFTRSFALFTRMPHALIGCFGANAAISMLHALSLWAALHSTGLHVSPFESLYILSVGVLAGSAVPVPGGVGSVEAGLLGTLAVFGQPFDASLSGVIIYRSITIWLPVLVGYPIFFRLTAKK